MKSLRPLSPRERDRTLTVHGTGHHLRYTLKQVQHLKGTYLELKLSSNGRRRRSAFQIPARSNDRIPLVLDPAKNLTRGVAKFHVEEHDGLNREAGHVVLDKARCLSDYMSGVMRFWSENHLNLDLHRCSITKMVDYSISVVAVEPRLDCLNRYPSCSAESTLFFKHGLTCLSSQVSCGARCERIL